MNDTGQTDLIMASGTALINTGSRVDVLAARGNWADSTHYTIIEAAGGVSGSFSDINTDLAFLTPSVNYDNNKVYLMLVRNDVSFANVTTGGTALGGGSNSYNQHNTGAGIESLGVGSAVYQQILGMNANQALTSYGNLSGEIHASIKSATLGASRYAQSAVAQHLALIANRVEPNNELWIDTWYNKGQLDADGNAAKLKSTSMGFLVGLDAFTQDTTTLGFALGYGRNKLKVQGSRASDADVDGFHLLAYGRAKAGAIDIKANVGYSWLTADSTRHISLPGLYNKNTASYDVNLLQAFIEASHSMDVSEQVSMTPYASLAYLRVNNAGFTEKGGVTALHTKRSSDATTSSTVGFRSSWAVSERSTVYTDLGWQHNVGRIAPQTELNFIGGARYRIRGVEIDRNSAIVGIGTDLQLQSNMYLGIKYTGVFGDQSRDNGLKLMWRLAF